MPTQTTLFLLFLLLLLLPLSFFLLLYLFLTLRRHKVPIKDRHVFISGGSSGIGLALARLAASEGAAKVSILARDPQKLRIAREEIRRANASVEAAAFSVDARDFEAVNAAVQEAGPIDVLVCNHGVFLAQELEEMGLGEVRYMVEANLMGTIHLIKAALPLMKKGRVGRGPGSIAIMSSQAGQVGLYGYATYCATKFGLRGLAEALQQEVTGDNIYVSLIFPPDTETPGLIEGRKTRPHITSFITASSRSMTAEEVARISIDGIRQGLFVVICNLKGLLLAITTAGLSPQSSYLMLLFEVVFAGIGRIIMLWHVWRFYSYIERCNSQKKKTYI